MNSIQAIQDKFGDANLSKGMINIHIDRSNKGLNIYVKDNGIGLNDENFSSFLTPDTDHKVMRGGKGVGRLTWLKTFYSTNISSFFDVDGKTYKRSFLFQNRENQAISNHLYEPCKNSQEHGTLIELIDMRGGYLQTFPSKGSTIANHIIRHFLPIFISGECPEISFFYNDEAIDISAELNNSIHEKSESTIHFTTSDKREEKLKIVHMRITSRSAPKSSPADMTKPGKARNAVYFAADQRVGFDYILDSQLGMTTFDGCKYIGVLEGNLINEYMNQERTHLDLPTDDIEKLKEKVFETVVEFLSRFMDEVKSAQKETIKKLSDDFPSITSSIPSDFIEKLPYSLSKPEDILANLAIHRIRAHKITIAETTKLAARIDEITKKDDPFTEEQEDEIIKIVENLRPKLTKETNASLAEYMTRRRAVIDLLNKYMGISDTGRHFKEDLIHSLICPMKKVDNSKKLLDHNLWLLDDRFAFYSFLASDSALKSFTPSSSMGRPDVLFVLDENLAFNRAQSNESPIFIVEFKRPSKSSYYTSGKKEWDTEDPFDRFIDYKESLEAGISGEQTYDGRHVKISKSRPIHCFLIADMTRKLEIKCKSRLSKIDGANSYFGHIPNLGFVHAISYEDLITNAQLRHELFFKKLGIDY